jgi:EmrB/QacA subfamily drug resistance transporter
VQVAEADALSGATAPARDRGRERAVLAAVVIGIGLAAVDGTVVTTAMPTAVRSLGGLDLYAWIYAAYTLAAAVSMPLWGKLADLRGSRGLFILGIVVFVAGSGLAGAAPAMTDLVACRALQGLGAGALSAVPFTVLGVTFPPSERSRVIGMGSATWGVASVVGPLLGSAIVSWLGWRWVFYVNVPVGVVAVALAWRSVPVRPAADAARRALDWLGAGVAAIGVTAFMLGLQLLPHGGGRGGWLVLAGALLLALFLTVERRAADPVLAPFLFRRRLFATANAIAFASAFAIFGVLDYLPLLVPPGVPLALGAAILVFPSSIAWSAAAFTTGRFVPRFGVRPIVTLGTALLAGGLALMIAVIRPGAGIWSEALASAPAGLGMGMLGPALLSGIQNALPLKDMGMGTAAEQFLQMVGGTVGVAGLQLAFLAGLVALPAGLREAVAGLLAGGGLGATTQSFAALSGAMRAAFALPLAAAVVGFGLTFALPRGTR